MGVMFTLKVKHTLKHYVSWGPKNTVYNDTTGYCKLHRTFVVVVSFSEEIRKILLLSLQTFYLLMTWKDVMLLLRNQQILLGHNLADSELVLLFNSLFF